LKQFGNFPHPPIPLLPYMVSAGFARGLGVTCLTLGCMFVGFYIQETQLRERGLAFNARVEAEVERALAEKEKRVIELEKQASQMLR
jgi:hypothetical protein